MVSENVVSESRLDQVISKYVQGHIEMCLNRQKNGFKVLEIEVPIEFAPKVFAKLNDEISIGGKLDGWVFGIFTQGEFEGKMAQTFLKDDMMYKRYFLKYTL